MSEEWISASQAWAVVWPGRKPTGGPNAIIRRAEVGAVKAKAFLLVKRGLGGETKEHACPIPEVFWGGGAMIPNWNQGDFSARVQRNGGEEDWAAIGVTFERSGIEAMVQRSALVGASQQSASSDVASPASATKNRGGRPPYDWEAVMIELAGQIYEGVLIPDKQAKIEGAIKNYFEMKDEEVSDSTARDHARPLYQRLTRKEEN